MEPGFAWSVEFGPVSSLPFLGSYRHRVDAGPCPVEDLLLGELLEHGPVGLLSNPGRLSLAQRQPGGVSGPVPQSRWQVNHTEVCSTNKMPSTAAQSSIHAAYRDLAAALGAG